LYLPEAWAADPERRRAVGVPDTQHFATKAQIALAQIRAANSRGVPRGIVLADAAYGSNTAFREGLDELALTYAVGVLSSTTVWAPGTAALPPAPYRGRGRVATRLRRAPGHQPLSVKALALSLKPSAWRRVTWRQGTNEKLSSRFARVRVRAAHRDYLRDKMREEEWLLVEWPRAESEPTKYWLSSLPADISIKRLVDTAKMRWRIEHDYHELKQEFGLSHYEGRGWLGFHHHATLCIAAYGFLTAQRLQQASKKNSARSQTFALPEDYQPRGSRTSTAPRARFHPNIAPSTRHSARQTSATVSLLRSRGTPCVTQYD
jgi:SRSO17 transposase